MNENFFEEINCQQFFEFDGTTNNESGDSYFDIDHETGLNISKRLKSEGSSACSGNQWYDAESMTPQPSTPNKRGKPRSSKKMKTSERASPCPYELRETPSRLSRLSYLLQTDTGAFVKATMKLTSTPSYILRSKTPLSDKKHGRSFPTASFPKNSTPLRAQNTTHGEMNFEAVISLERQDENANPNVSVPRNHRVTFMMTSSITPPSNTRVPENYGEGACAVEMPILKSLIRKSTPRQGYYLKQNNSPMFEAQSSSFTGAKPKIRSKVPEPVISKEKSLVSLKRLAKPASSQKSKKMKVCEPSGGMELDFVSTLRRTSPRNNVKKLRVTRPKPFNLTRGGNRMRDETLIPTKAKTLAEQVNIFHKGTPLRFRTRAAGTVFQPQKHMTSPQLVRPKSPKLRAAARHRPTVFPSQKEMDEQEIQKMKDYKFQARPFNKHIVTSPDLVKPQHQSPTKPVGIKLATEGRMAERKKVEREETFVFKAQAVPANIFKAPMGVKEKKTLKPTVPASPGFALKKRAAQWSENKPVSHDLNENAIFKALPRPNFDSPFTVKHIKKCTTAKPFSFDSADKERYELKEKKIQVEIENESQVPDFHARPLPPSVLTPRPQRSVSLAKKVTVPEPFNLHWVDTASTIKRIQMLEEEKLSQQTQFKARPATVIKQKPFVPAMAPREDLEILEPHLSTEVRAIKRLKDRDQRLSMEAEKEAKAQERQVEKEKEQKEAIRKFRQEIVHKAMPVRHYRGVRVQPSSKPLTTPQSPTFATSRGPK